MVAKPRFGRVSDAAWGLRGFPSRKPAGNPFAAAKLVTQHLCGLAFLGKIKEGGQGQRFRESGGGFPLRDGEHFALRSSFVEWSESHGTVGGAQIDADAKLRINHILTADYANRTDKGVG